MASTGASTIPPGDTIALIRQINGQYLVNRQLSSICQINGLKSTGVKAELQQRIINLIQETVNRNDVARFHQIRQSIANTTAQGRSSPARAASSRNNIYQNTSPHGMLQTSMSNSMTPFQVKGSNSNHNLNGFQRDLPFASSGSSRLGSYGSSMSPRLTFPPSPFYQVEASLGDVRVLDIMSQHRNSVTIPIKLNDHYALQKCVEDKSYRVMVFCAGDSQGVQNIAFPHQSEIKVNGGDIKANLRGLKNKPGSTRPVDITDALRLRAAYTNNIEFTYALTNRKFYLMVSVCKVTPVKDLVSRIVTRRRIPKDSVIAELNKKARDPDVVATSQVLSLRCPLSYMRLDVPCRGLSCSHIQCFDATSYLQLQEQGPQWLCPICNRSATFSQLAVDEYVRDILDNTSKSLETVTIEPNGRWHAKPKGEDGPRSSNGASFLEDDDLEISETNSIGVTGPANPMSAAVNLSTPTSNGVRPPTGASSGTPSRTGTNSLKRPAPEVIDLTLSSDEEDDEPIARPPKRQNTGTNGYRRSGFLSESPVRFTG